MGGPGHTSEHSNAGDSPEWASIDVARSFPEVFYLRPVVAVARDLLGCLLVTVHSDGLTVGIIVETEAYAGPEDAASHAAFRRTGAVRAMWGPAGHAYVYRAYGVYPCFNVVTGANGHASAVLVRALKPVIGLELMARRSKGKANLKIASGPGKLSLALKINAEDNGRPLDRPPIWIQSGPPPDGISVGPRIGVKRGEPRPWRFGITGCPSLSHPFPPKSETKPRSE